MISGTVLIAIILAIPLSGVAAAIILPLGAGALLRVNAAVALLQCAAVIRLFYCLPGSGRLFGFNNNLFIDALSIYHIGLVAMVFLLSSTYALSYFSEQIDKGVFSKKRAQRFSLIWNGFFAILTAVLCSNNLGLLWVCLEATTLISALLIMTDGKPSSIEAMWKYLLICSVGIAFAFVGTLLVSVAARQAGFSGSDSLLWTALNDRAGVLNGQLMLAAFVFVIVGFGTKAGLAPMHTWLPDAHSQAPTPVSAVFSGVMLNCALYCIMRYLPICEKSLGFSGRPHTILMAFGLLSILIAAVFIPSQKDMKRFLAYCSVEHLGIIALGIGIGGLGTFAALFHTLNHSLAKSLSFFSAGRLGQQYGTYDMSRIKGALTANPVWGCAFFISILVLLGMAPFSIFMSEFQLVKAGIDKKYYITVAILLAGLLIVFVSALRFAITVSSGKPEPLAQHVRLFPRDIALVIGSIAVLLLLGLYMPQEYFRLLDNATAIVNGGALK
jgi:hydrogenase-4 component F